MNLSARRITVTGVVQGVGFRPFVYRLAHAHGLTGWVLNHSGGVEIAVEGAEEALAAFVRDLEAQAPPRARIAHIIVADVPPAGYTAFEIRESVAEEGRYQLVSPDIATCPDCLRELLDPADRRYRYPFTNCTNCGPRFTIIADIPYDRPLTTMRAFVMCPQCQAEYDDPLDRRFHAQPNACPVCGPHVWLEASQQVGKLAGLQITNHKSQITDSLAQAADLLRAGHILAIKGLGGFHLACDATNDDAVRTLRERKRRPDKPLAVMMATLEEIRRHCHVSEEEERLLTSPECPIVLLRWKPESDVSWLVAPRNGYLGVMLPYTPLHHILLRDVGRPLVMTSGNLSEEPIARDNDEALRRLAHLADEFLLHNRDIYSRYDDSVWFVPLAEPQPIRRARGYAPFPIVLPFKVGKILACGPELKNTFCLTRDEYAFVSQHIGDMENLETLEHFEETVALYKRLFRVEPEVIAHDLHPDYLTTKWAREQEARSTKQEARSTKQEAGSTKQEAGSTKQEAGGKRQEAILHPASCLLHPVQHHHAHIAACLADNGWRPEDGPVIGVAWDGTGYGSDGHIWGGEFLVADYRGFQRVGHLEYLPMPGGEAAIRNPYRLAIGYLYALTGHLADWGMGIGEEELQVIRQQVDRRLNCPYTSAGGRLFDAVSAFLGVCARVSYEGQAAVELEMQASQYAGAQVCESRVANHESRITSHESPFPYPFDIEGEAIRLERFFEALLADRERGVPVAEMAWRFHGTVAEMIGAFCERVAAETGLRTAALSGGCFQNRLLLALTVPRLERAGLRVLLHRQVPCNDGGVSLGQAVIAHFSAE